MVYFFVNTLVLFLLAYRLSIYTTSIKKVNASVLLFLGLAYVDVPLIVGLAVLSVATDFGKHLLILIFEARLAWLSPIVYRLCRHTLLALTRIFSIFDHLVFSSQGASRVVFFYCYYELHHCSMFHYCVLFYSLIWWYNGCRFSSHFDISLRKVRVSFTTQGHCKLSEISPALKGSKLSEIILDVWRLKPANLHTHLVACKNQVRKHIIVKSLNRKIIWHIQFKHR